MAPAPPFNVVFDVKTFVLVPAGAVLVEVVSSGALLEDDAGGTGGGAGGADEEEGVAGGTEGAGGAEAELELDIAYTHIPHRKEGDERLGV